MKVLKRGISYIDSLKIDNCKLQRLSARNIINKKTDNIIFLLKASNIQNIRFSKDSKIVFNTKCY
jgi:hypothetical protein